MLWTESTIRKIAREEARSVLSSSVGARAIRDVATTSEVAGSPAFIEVATSVATQQVLHFLSSKEAPKAIFSYLSALPPKDVLLEILAEIVAKSVVYQKIKEQLDCFEKDSAEEIEALLRTYKARLASEITDRTKQLDLALVESSRKHENLVSRSRREQADLLNRFEAERNVLFHGLRKRFEQERTEIERLFQERILALSSWSEVEALVAKSIRERLTGEAWASAKEDISEWLGGRIHHFVVGAVNDFVKRHPIYDEWLSNKEIAAANGVSIRQVKRWRRQSRYYGVPLADVIHEV